MSISLHYKKFGSGSPLLILHGLLGTGNNWGTIARQLSETHEVYALDLRNHGRSPHTETMDYEAMAQDVVDFMDEHKLEKATILGHSMGGKVAMTLALSHKERVEKLIVADIAPVVYQPEHHYLVEALQSLDLSQVEKREHADQQLQASVPEVGLRMFLLNNLAFQNKRYQWRCNLDVIEKDLSKIYGFPEVSGSYPGKTLFVGGANSNYILRQHYAHIFRFFPNNTILMLNDAGHWLHADQPEAFLKTVQQFL